MARMGSNGGPPYRPRGGVLVGLAGWAALVGVTGAVGWLALGACGIAWRDGRPLLDFCPAPAADPPPSSALLAEEQRSRELERRLADLRLALIAAPDCPAPPQPEIAVAALDEPPPEPDPDPPFALPQHRPEPPPDISAEDWEEQDLALLEGCWRLISDQTLEDVNTGREQPMLDWRICFDAGGNGNQIVNAASLGRCQGPVHATFHSDGNLAIDSPGRIPCGAGFIHQIFQDCERRDDGTARCVGRQPETSRYGIVSTFRR